MKSAAERLTLIIQDLNRETTAAHFTIRELTKEVQKLNIQGQH